MQKLIVVALAALALAGCGITRVAKDVSPGFEWSSSTTPYFITGEITKTSESDLFSSKLSYRLSVAANGVEFISGALAREFVGTASGTLDSLPAVASCSGARRSADWIDVTCEIAVSGKRIGTLKF